MLKYVLPLAALTAMTAPAFAAEFYVVRDPDTKIVVLGNKAFVTKDEAEKQITVLCKD